MAELKLNLVIRLLDQATAPVRRLGQTVARLDKPFRAARMAAGGLLRDVRQLAMVGAAAGAALGVALYQSVRRYADVGDAALETSQKVGVGVPTFLRWSHAAKQGGVEAASLEDALKFLSLSSSAAADGAKQDQVAFARLGVAYRDARGRLIPLEQLLPRVADRFAQMEDGPRKSAIAVALFGRAGLAMIPMLNEGSAGLKKWGDEAERLGIVMSQRGAEQADEFNDSLNTLHQSIFGLGNGIAGGLLPQLTSVIQRLTQMIAANKPEILRRTQAIFAQIGAALPGIIKGLGDFARFLGQIAAVVGPVVQALGGFNNVLDLLAVIVVGKVAIAIWSAVAAVWGLNGAMLANPVGLVIVAIAALVLVVVGLVRQWKPISAFFAGVWAQVVGKVRLYLGVLKHLFLNFSPVGLIIKHWASIVGFFQGLWKRIGDAFKAGVAAVWNMLPPWFQQVLRGASFVVRAVSGVGSPPAGDGGSTPRPSPAVGAAARATFSGEIGVRAIPDRDGRVPEVFARSSTPGFTLAPVGGVPTRGGR